MRSDIINEVLSVEDRAQKIVRDASNRARDYISEAQLKSGEIVRSSLKEVREQNHTELLQAEADAQLRLAEFEASLDISSVLSEQTLDQIANRIVDKICKTDFIGVESEQ